MRPGAAVDISRLVLKEVHGDVEELQAGSSSEENDLIAVRYGKKLLPKLAGLLHYCLPLLRPMGDGQYGNPRTLEILYCLTGLVIDLLRKQAWSCIENMKLFIHFGYSFIWLCAFALLKCKQILSNSK